MNANPPPPMQAGVPCGGCGSSDRWILHTLRHRASYRRLCTDCVLKNHQSLFCPLCLAVFDKDSSPLPPPADRLICLNCPSISHRSCVPPNESAVPSFLCPPCSNPSFTFFNPNGSGDNKRVIDKNLAKVLLAAARISAASMNKAAATARLDAERRAKEAAFAKKKAREALDRLALLFLKENENGEDKKPIRLSQNGVGLAVEGIVQGVNKATNGLLSLSAVATASAPQRSSHSSKE
ncbi:uncharacterized protein LOC121237949 [Juglans microcarpa x Juglans regia]|uniref:uncharacterized protein LOC121237949 n=1 Tax=Juglans microcarpa x Juglans regia TaxID=2249226 RepID=UPI001B7EFEA9|nr:uncharacterized protein LOC121237949 [Juglans microcarpa x Juglans regia]